MAMRYSDQPITRPGEDALGRASFAFELARSIDNLSVAGEGFVMALVGEWGAGKTSVIELIVRYLRHIEMERASRHQLVGESQPSPQTIDQIELLAIELIKFDQRSTPSTSSIWTRRSGSANSAGTNLEIGWTLI
jgi:KAP family P-loop domain